MEPKTLLDFLGILEKLKSGTRHAWTSEGTQETVAAHSWRLSMLSFLLQDTFPEIDMQKVTDMCLVHDIGEAVKGDIPVFLKTQADEASEQDDVDVMLSILPEPVQSRMHALFAEMHAQETEEAKLWLALDKLEATIQHNESDISTWLPLEYELNKTYGIEEAAVFPKLAEIRDAVLEDTLRKIEAEGKAKKS